ncbi:MAG: flagellar assembly protein FliX [Devosia sp.]
MRIPTTNRSSNIAGRAGVGRPVSGGAFSLDGADGPTHLAGVQSAVPSSGIEALLALQSVGDPLLSKKKSIRRGNALLDTLESIKADLLLGRVSEGRLNQLMVLILSARERRDPALDGLLDDIELRARVELAKFGRYPGM